jgi:hypothetical protein
VGNVGFIRNQIHAKSQPAGHGWKPSCALLNQSCWCASARRQRKPFLVRHSALLESAARYCHRNLRRELSPRFIHRLFFDNRTRNRGNASMKSLWWTFARHEGQPARNRLPHSSFTESRVLYSATNPLRNSSNVPCSISVRARFITFK